MQPKKTWNVVVTVQEGVYGQYIEGAIVRFKKKNSRHVAEGITEQSVCLFTIDSTGCFQVEVEKKGYINARQEFYHTKLTENHDSDNITFKVIILPVLPPSIGKSIGNEDGNQNLPMSKLRVIIDTSGCNVVNPPRFFYKEKDENSEEPVNCNISVEKAGDWFYGVIESNQDMWIRILVEISDLKTSSYSLLDKHALTNMKYNNCRMILYSDNRELGHVSPYLKSSFLPVWDIGLLNVVQKKFLQTNTFITPESVEKKRLQKFFLKFVKYLNEQNQFYNFSLIFGFNEGVFKFDDYYIPADQFISRLSQLDIAWINENAKEEIIQEQKSDLEEFFEYMKNAFTNIFGEVPLKRVTERLSPHLALAHK